MLLLGIAGITLLAVWLIGMVIYRKIVSRSTQRRVSQEISGSVIGKIVDRFTKFVASENGPDPDSEGVEQFHCGQRLRFHLWNNGNGPLISGTVVRLKGWRAFLRGDDGGKYRRRLPILAYLNHLPVPTKQRKLKPVAVDNEAFAFMHRIENASGFGAVNPSSDN